MFVILIWMPFHIVCHSPLYVIPTLSHLPFRPLHCMSLPLSLPLTLSVIPPLSVIHHYHVPLALSFTISLSFTIVRDHQLSVIPHCFFHFQCMSFIIVHHFHIACHSQLFGIGLSIVYHLPLSVIPIIYHFPLYVIPYCLSLLIQSLSVIPHCHSPLSTMIITTVGRAPLSVIHIICNSHCMPFPIVCHSSMSVIPDCHSPLSIISHCRSSSNLSLLLYTIVHCLLSSTVCHSLQLLIHYYMLLSTICYSLSSVIPSLQCMSFPIVSSFPYCIPFSIVWHCPFSLIPIISHFPLFFISYCISFPIICHSSIVCYSPFSVIPHCPSLPIVCHSHYLSSTIVCHCPLYIISHCLIPIVVSLVYVIVHCLSFPLSVIPIIPTIVCKSNCLSLSIICHRPLSVIVHCLSSPIVSFLLFFH